MNSKKNFDPVKAGRKAHARLFDIPVVFNDSEELADLIRNTVQEFIAEGIPGEFHDWLDQKIPDYAGNDVALFCKGLAYKAENMYSEAETYYKAALEIREKGDDREKISFTLQELSALEIAKGNLSEAWNYLDRGMDALSDQFEGHYNRLALAADTRDRTRLEAAYRDLCEKCPKWYENPNANLLKSDQELQFLREEMPELWAEIKALI